MRASVTMTPAPRTDRHLLTPTGVFLPVSPAPSLVHLPRPVEIRLDLEPGVILDPAVHRQPDVIVRRGVITAQHSESGGHLGPCCYPNIPRLGMKAQTSRAVPPAPPLCARGARSLADSKLSLRKDRTGWNGLRLLPPCPDGQWRLWRTRGDAAMEFWRDRRGL